MAEFGASDDVTGPLTVRSALSHLRQLADDALFEPQEIKAPLVVIDPQTCAGMRFDATWVTGLEASHWPEPAAADPFLPRDWQVRRGVPGASPELAAAAAHRTLARLQRDGGETIFSIPGFEDATPLLPSPLVLSLPPAEKPPLWHGLAVAPAVFAARPALERLTDGALPGIATYDLAHGGTRVIELQAACPFRAAVELRLGGREFEEPTSGIDATERGNVAHAVLKALWDELREQRVLAALSRERRLQLVQGYIERELAPLRAAASGVLQHLLELEQRWLEARIMELLDVDLARPPFAVADTELAASVEVGGLQVRLQLDRVDRLGDGSLAIIDYKTGANAAPADWMGERPRSPQLPLYVRALDAEKSVRLLSPEYARVRRNTRVTRATTRCSPGCRASCRTRNRSRITPAGQSCSLRGVGGWTACRRIRCGRRSPGTRSEIGMSALPPAGAVPDRAKQGSKKGRSRSMTDSDQLLPR